MDYRSFHFSSTVSERRPLWRVSDTVTLTEHGRRTIARVHVRRSPPSRSDIQRDEESRRSRVPVPDILLYVVPKASAGLAEAASVVSKFAVVSVQDGDAIARQAQTVRDAAAELDVIVSGDPALVAWDVQRTGSPDADDAAVQALTDVAEITKRIEDDRIVGGHRASLLLSAFPVRGALLRRTADADLTPFQAQTCILC